LLQAFAAQYPTVTLFLNGSSSSSDYVYEPFEYVFTPVPTPEPTEEPTVAPVPTAAPTMLCDEGEYIPKNTNYCMYCPPGTSSSNRLSCTICEPGTFSG